MASRPPQQSNFLPAPPLTRLFLSAPLPSSSTELAASSKLLEGEKEEDEEGEYVLQADEEGVPLLKHEVTSEICVH